MARVALPFVPSPGKSSRREQILDAAAELFAGHGFHGVGIDDIGAAVGISGPALYRHFRSKDAMLAEMLTLISEKLLAGGRDRVAALTNSQHALRELVRFHVDFALDNSALITVHMRDLGNLTDVARRQVRGLQRRYVEVWVQVIRGAVPDTDEPTARAAAHAVFGLLNSTPYSAHLDRVQMAELLHRMAIGAVVAPGALFPAASSPAPSSPAASSPAGS